jgi:ribose/xylose/arabinose/galactoside ABC-type transport system permease subunit
MSFNLLDVICVVVIAVAVVFGWRSGFVVQAFALAGFLAGLALVVLPRRSSLARDAPRSLSGRRS